MPRQTAYAVSAPLASQACGGSVSRAHELHRAPAAPAQAHADASVTARTGSDGRHGACSSGEPPQTLPQVDRQWTVHATCSRFLPPRPDPFPVASGVWVLPWPLGGVSCSSVATPPLVDPALPTPPHPLSFRVTSPPSFQPTSRRFSLVGRSSRASDPHSAHTLLHEGCS